MVLVVLGFFFIFGRLDFVRGGIEFMFGGVEFT